MPSALVSGCSGGEYFANVWSDAGPEGQAILRELVRTGAGVEASRRQPSEPGYQLGFASTGTALKWLREHDVLDDAGKFAIPMVERWVRENAL